MSAGELEVQLQVETYFILNLKKSSFFNKLHRVLSLEVSHTCLKNCNTGRRDCSLTIESRLCVGLTESRTQHRWVAEYESDSQYFVRRDAYESTLSPSGNGP